MGGGHRGETSEESHVPCPAEELEPNWKWMSDQAVNPEDLASNGIKTMGQKGTSSSDNMSQCHYLWDHLINCQHPFASVRQDHLSELRQCNTL